MGKSKYRKLFRTGMMGVILALVLVVALSACQTAPKQTSTSTPATSKPIIIGGPLPLTGGLAANAKSVKEGYEVMVAEINAKGGLLGRPVELKIYDDGMDPQKTVTLLEKAITVDKVDLILPTYGGTTCAAAMPLADKYRMLMVTQGGHMPSFSQGYKYVFGSPPLMGQWWYVGLFDWFASLPAAEKPKTVACLSMNTAIGKACKASVDAGVKQLGMEMVVDEWYDLPLTSADSLVSKAKASNADLFISNGLIDDGILTVRSAKSLRYNPKFYAQSIGCLQPEWVKTLGADANYIFSSTAMHWKLPYAGVDKLEKIAKEKYGYTHAPDYFLMGYCWMQSLVLTVEGAGTTDGTKMRDWLTTHEISTVGGKYTFDEKGLPKPFSIITQIIDGSPELIWPKDARSHDPVYPKPAWSQQ